MIVQMRDSLIDISLNFNNVGFINHSSFACPSADQDMRKEGLNIKITLEKQSTSDIMDKFKSGSNEIMLDQMLKHPYLMFNHGIIEESHNLVSTWSN